MNKENRGPISKAGAQANFVTAVNFHLLSLSIK